MNLKIKKLSGGLRYATLSFDLEKRKRGAYVSIALSSNSKIGGVNQIVTQH